MSWQLRLPDLFRPVTRLLPRGTGRVLNLFVGRDDELWKHSPRRHRTFFDRSLGATVSVDLAEWYGRLHYYAGRYYDLDIPHVIRQTLGSGDTFIDVGAHYGMHTLLASRIVGPSGRVISFEPNPQTFEILQNHLEMNDISNATVHNVGLSDVDDSLTLRWNDTAMASFVGGAEGEQTVNVPVVRGDDALEREILPGKLLIKIDAEGFEHRVIKGLSRTIDRPNVTLVVEMTDQWLRRAGSSAKALLDDLVGRGFSPHEVHTRLTLRGARVRIEPMKSLPAAFQYDLVFRRNRSKG